MLWIVLCATLAVVESGDWSAILRAQQLFHEVYGKRIEAAKTAAEKSALAREILELAKKESDSAAKRVELEEAKRLAVQAMDGALALEAVRVFAASFGAHHDSDPHTLLQQAETLWQQAETKEGSERLSQQVEAIALYLRCKNAPSLVAKYWQHRIQQIMTSGAVMLRAKDAIIHASRASYSSEFDAICYWKDPQEWFEWTTSLAAGKYQLGVEYAAFGSGAGSAFIVALFRGNAVKPSAVILFTLQSTASWREFRWRDVGVVAIPSSGEYRIEFRVARPRSYDGFINIRSLRFSPLR